MADEVQETPNVEQPTAEGANTATATGTNGDAPVEKVFTQAELERILSERLAKERTKGEAAAKKAQADAEAKALAEQGKYEELYKKAQADLEAAQRQATEAQQALLRREVGAKYNLPLALVDRRRGDTPEELDADAQALLAALPKPAAPNINSGTGNGRVPTPGVMDEQAKRELAAVLNVNPKYL